MKTILYKIIICLLFVPILSYANNGKGKYKKSKTIHKEFSVNSDALLKINNRYGNVDITSWDENRVVFEIEITVSGNNEDKVISKLDGIHVDFDANKHEVYAKTKINKNKSSSWFSWGSFNNNLNYKINYKVKMPKSNNLNIYNDYGSISLNELDGEANINCDYGKIVIGSLNNQNNTISTDYSNHSTIEFMNGGKIDADYSKFTVGAAKNILLDANYSTSNFENIENLKFNCDYGKIKVDKANYIEGDGDYLSMRFGKIYKKIELDADYGSIRIAAMQNNFESVKIDSDYTGIKIGVNADATCNIEIELSYASLNTDGDFTFPKKNIKSTSKYYKGYFKDQNNNATIQIDSDYGSVKLFENQ